ncbi:Proteophosphoglycan ppg4 [Rhodotorula toruloides ATCC 204091]|uniref:DNA replication regulator SLD2 n=1 Tax=Rhodotorula toruloides TaxID=5286 RepID=A0A0K3CJE9_RHOTO|nr:Proteophosphoglycan ppg4 [Rhodotorula toruloides ATCC 204091]KAK4336432.1 Proteophosphoglycan ppg4 [Rhodotorula toruloides]PRQ74225.1 Proteophosphoglycan ppg4 [Rhodotorula toruloides]
MASLRQELKQFEQQFRAEHGRDPSKDDIKQRPDIAKKYRDYAKSKASSGKEAKKASSSSSSTRPLAAPSASASSSSNPFRTPTKPKTARQRAPAASSTNDVDLSSETTAGPASPFSRLSGSKSRDPQSQSSTTTTRYVLANSPSKVRALAALHSSTGSPNQPSHFPSSPQKRASNPFASPTKGAGSFAALEKAERERLKQRKKEEKERKAKLAGKGSGGVLGNKATAAGAGWGSVATLGDRPFARTSSAASSAMEVDEVDEFFGAPASSFSSQRSVFSSQRSLAPATQVDFDNAGLEDDDEVFGPSPVKPSASLASKKSFSLLPSIDDAQSLSLPLFAPSSSQPGPSKPFKPLLPPAASPQPASQTSNKPIPFATALPFPTSSATNGANGTDAEKEDFWADTAKKEEEAKKAKGARGGKRKKAGAAADDAAVPSKRKAPAKRATGKGKGKGKAKASEEDEDGEMDLEAQDEGDGEVVSSQKGEIVIALSDEEQEGGGKARLIIHEKGWKARAGQRARHTGSKKDEMDRDGEAEGMVVDVMQGEQSSDGDEEDVDETSLFAQRGRSNLLSTLDAAPSNGANDAVNDQPDTSNLPADLAAILSLRSNSPRKSSQNGRHTLSSLAKEQQVARLLGEPIAGRRRTGRLLDLADEEQDEAEGAEVEDGAGDDDWDEEVDGWEGTGEAMDGYYSGDGEVW